VAGALATAGANLLFGPNSVGTLQSLVFIVVLSLKAMVVIVFKQKARD
jgi:hypothetical protein